MQTEEQIAAAQVAAQQEAEARGDTFVPEVGSGVIQLDAMDNKDILAMVADGDKTQSVVAPEATPPVSDTDKKEDYIPRARFNEINERNKAMEIELEALRSKGTQTPAQVSETEAAPVVSEYQQLQAQRVELRKTAKALDLEGQSEEASAVEEKIDALNEQMALIRFQEKSEQKESQRNVAVSMNEVAVKAYEQYPFLDVESETCDMDAVLAVKALRDELVTAGKTPAQALQAAVKEKGPKFARLLGVETTTVDPAVVEKTRQARELAARTTAANASTRQPAVMPGKNQENFALDIDKMSDTQFKQLKDTDTLAKARGDIV